MEPVLLQNYSHRPSHSVTCTSPGISLIMCLTLGLAHSSHSVFSVLVGLTCLYVVWAEGAGLGKGSLKSPLSLIDGSGKIASTREVVSRIGRAKNVSKGGRMRVFGVLNSKGTRCGDILERIMGVEELTPRVPEMTEYNKEKDQVSR